MDQQAWCQKDTKIHKPICSSCRHPLLLNTLAFFNVLRQEEQKGLKWTRRKWIWNPCLSRSLSAEFVCFLLLLVGCWFSLFFLWLEMAFEATYPSAICTMCQSSPISNYFEMFSKFFKEIQVTLSISHPLHSFLQQIAVKEDFPETPRSKHCNILSFRSSCFSF